MADPKPTKKQQDVLNYLKEHKVPEKLNDIINVLCKSHPADAFAFLSNEFMKEQVITITGIKARQIFDSRGNPTLEVDVTTQRGVYTAAVPSGASTGIYEAKELRDGGDNYMGKGVLTAVENVNTIIAPTLIGMDPREQKVIDELMVQELDGSKNEWGYCKETLGANAILGVSMAVCRAGAGAEGVELYQHIANLAGNTNQPLVMPVPSLNIINGGSHAGNKLAMQEFMILPTEAKSFTEAMRMGAEVYQHLKKVIKAEYGQDAINVGDEGGFAPNIGGHAEALEMIKTAIENAGYTGKVKFGTDVAASEFFENKDGQKVYNLNFKDKDAKTTSRGKKKGGDDDPIKDADGMTEIYKSFCSDYPMVTIEDPFDQDDWEAWTALTAELGETAQIVGDDLLVTNPIRIQKAIEEKSCNALLLKVNQIGTVSESIEAVRLAKQAGWGVMTSHRSGETEDTFIADLAVGLSTGQIKSGAPCRSERLAKYNRLLRIEEQLGANATYAGTSFRKPCDPY